MIRKNWDINKYNEFQKNRSKCYIKLLKIKKLKETLIFFWRKLIWENANYIFNYIKHLKRCFNKGKYSPYNPQNKNSKKIKIKIKIF